MSHFTSKFKSTPTITLKSRNSSIYLITEQLLLKTNLLTHHRLSSISTTIMILQQKLEVELNFHNLKEIEAILLLIRVDLFLGLVVMSLLHQWINLVLIRRRSWKKDSLDSDNPLILLPVQTSITILTKILFLHLYLVLDIWRGLWRKWGLLTVIQLVLIMLLKLASIVLQQCTLWMI